MPDEGGHRCLPAALADRLHAVELTARRRMAGARAGRHRSPRQGDSVEFADHRPYYPGDPIQRIDWRAWARTDRYLIRRFEAEVSLTGMVIVDASASMGWSGGEGRPTKMEAAIRLAASFLWCLVHQADRGGLVVADGGAGLHRPPVGALPGLVPLLDDLDAVVPTGAGNLGEALVGAAPRLPARSLVLVVSDLLVPVTEVARGLQALHHHGHDVRVAHLVDPAELDLPPGGLMELEDAETSERIEVDGDELRRGWRAAVEDHHEALRRACQGCPAGYRRTRPDDAPERVLAELA